MAKSEKKRSQGAASSGRGGVSRKGRSEAAKHVTSLLHLHKWQGELLKQLQKELR